MLFCSVCKLNLVLILTFSKMLNNSILRNGAAWSGYFAALCNSIDKMQTEQIIDPFKIVRLLRAVRPQFIDQVSITYIWRKKTV